MVGDPTCGDYIEVFIKVEAERIVDFKFLISGCPAAISTSSIATELAIGKTIEEAEALTNKAVAEALDGLPPVKVHCSVLAEDGLKAAIADYRKRQEAKENKRRQEAIK